jgi:YbbR domain-containing protein
MDGIRAFLNEVGLITGALLRPAARSVRENSGLAVLSVVLAFGLWVFVTRAENPEQTRRIEEAVPIRAVNVPADVAAPRDLGEVGVQVRVEENVFDSLTKEDFEATVDLAGLSVGAYKVPVKVRPLTSRGNLRIVDVITEDSNDEITVRLAQLLSKTVPVKLEMRGTPPADFSVGATEADSDTAVVSGPQDSVGAVIAAVALVDVEARTETFEGAVRLEPRNEQGVLVEDLNVDPATVNVKIEIEQRTFSRALAVSPQLKGVPRQGHNVVGASVDPLIVTVFGPQAFIEEATTISTQPVDIEDANADVVRTVSLDLPSGITIKGSVNVTVTVSIRPAPGQLTFAVPLTANGLGNDLSIVGALPPVQVFLFGPLPVLLELNPNDISASVDLDGKGGGTHKVKVKVSAPDGLEVRSVSPEELEIQLEQR